MAQIDVVDLGGQKVGSLELADEIFAADQINEALLWEAVKHYRAAMRQGTAATKNKKLVSGAGKKLWKQKGTGRARVGSVRSPLWRHGGTVHGPQPRSYDYAFPRKKLLGALRSALASKLADGKLTVVESLELADAKTKAYRAALDKLDAKRTTLLVEGGQEPGRVVAARFAQPRSGGVAAHQGSSSLRSAALRAGDFFPRRNRAIAGVVEEDCFPAQACGRFGGGLMPTLYNVIKRPLITEKGLGVKEVESTLVFDVAPDATKTEVKQAVETLFKVKVRSVRTANFLGKERRRGKFSGFRPDWKKAYVRLQKGEKMPDYVNAM